MKEIGGYIEFEQNNGSLIHEQAVALNCGRNCLAYLIRTKKIKKIMLPYFLCDSVRDLCESYNVKIRYYSISQDFLPEDITLQNNEWLYIVNYYGQIDRKVMDGFVKKYKNVIVDQAQAYFDTPIKEAHTIYTCRKFLGVPDGAFLYTDTFLDTVLDTDISYERMHFLLGRFERPATEFYAEYVKNNLLFDNEPLKKMSLLTTNLLRGIDYDYIKQKRTENFKILKGRLTEINLLNVRENLGPFAYPLLLKNGAEVRKKLLNYNIYIPTLWPNVLEDVAADKLEYDYALNILPLPCDQRYGKEEMEYLCERILLMEE